MQHELDMIDILPLGAMTATPTSSPTSTRASVAFVTSPRSATSIPKKPADPLAWLWQCHICHRTYHLAVTRRCLDDGHYFCSGVTIINKRDQKPRVKRHGACASEFDYNGWRAAGQWRRVLRSDEEDQSDKENIDVKKSQTKQKKDCWNKCDYPSQCRWGDRFAPKQPRTVVPATVKEVQSEMPIVNGKSEQRPPKTTFEDMLVDEPASPSRESKFHEHMEDIDSSDLVKQDIAIQQTICETVTTRSLDELECEIRKSIQRVSDMAVEAMLQFRVGGPEVGRRESLTQMR
ncbi:Hypothetical protein D9617_24g016340 [Elsinoe fawcettii]|nr:Hypothetical protein D9617_24g016340 [Elsinoe fawcettii]